MSSQDNLRNWTAMVILPLTVICSTWLHQASEERQVKQRHQDEVALKFIELGWDAIEKHDTQRTREALRVLALFDPVMAEQLNMVAVRDSVQPTPNSHEQMLFAKELAEAGLIGATISVKSLGEESRNLSQAVANYIERIQHSGPITIEWTRKTGSAHMQRSSFIAYATELEPQAIALRMALEERFPQLGFELRAVGTDERSIMVAVAP